MANPHNVELEAAKFLHKLIQDSKDEPTKLATKLYVILQHMRSSGKENSMPYQVISRAMETVIKQHGLDIEALMSSRLPLASGAQLGESGSPQVAGSSQRTGVTKDPKASLAGNEMSKPDSFPSSISHVGPNSGGHDAYQGSPSNMTGGAGKVHGMTPAAASSYPPVETGVSMPMQFASSSYDTHGYSGKMHKEGMEAFSAAPPSMDPYAGKNITGRALDHEGGANVLPNANKLNQAGIPSNVPETSMLRSAALRDTGKAPVTQAPVSGLPFKEHHLKQLRAQCLVFLAFRNGLLPKKLHLDIALGNFFPKEEGPRREMIDQKGKEQSVHEPNNFPEASRPSAGHDNMRGIDRLPSGAPASGIYSEGNISKEADNNTSMKEDKSSHHAMPYEHTEERRLHLALRRKPETEMPKQETSESLASSVRGMKYDSNTRNIPVGSREDDSGSNHQQPVIPHPASFVSGTIKHLKPEASNWPGNGYQNEACKVSAPASGLTHESQHRKDNAASQSQNPADGYSLGHRHTGSNLPSLPLREQWKPISGIDGNVPLMPTKDSDVLVKHVLPVQEPDMQDEDISLATDRPPSPKYTTSEKWILDRQKRKFLTEKMWALKQQKIEQKKIAVCSAKLKENVISSEDINAKTKSVIELKKLKLLDLQRRLRSDILSDFFKPIASEMDRLKSIKKHRIGRRSKQLERYEQKMKEERQKRIRERQKEFFSEVEVHRERLEDAFKMKRERWKGFNKYVREFHKRKERIHREKIDRIQREKINLLKINDVEGYLRMVQDAKSDRVKQLLKETEKYLQKLGSKLQEAKTVARRFETDMDDSRTSTTIEKNEFSYENEDETDQAKHYLESNEKYYLMAHSVKETVLEQPTMLLGGKLREYQMNGLRWLVSLYNNHLNGILADEMGLGKTVQVISLLCYLMETKNDRGPFLVVVPSSVLPGWESEINFWAPAMQKIIYSGPPEERRRLFKEQIVHQKFNVLLTTYEYLMNKHDRPKLSKVQWHYIIIDEGHRIKNASCKLNADLKLYRSNHRLLLTGTPLQNNLEELWALLNFLLPNIFNSSEDFSQWFNKPFESNGDNSPDEALLSEEENLLIINRLHQVLRPFVLRRLKHKVENELPEKIERLIRCEASAYQKLLMKRVEENLGAIGSSKARSVHNSVMELRNICNHPYLSQLHAEEVHEWIPNHYLPNLVRLCGKLEMLDRLLPKLKATDHRVLLFSTMTRLLDVMEDYLCWKQYKYLRLDGHTSGGDRGALIDRFNEAGSPFFIFLLSIRAGGVGVNLQAADTVIIFDTDWNPQVDLQAQARAHRIGQKRDVLVLRLETVQTVEEQVRASAEHKLGVANQSITAGFFDNNTSAEDRREYLESLLRESKKEEAAPVLDDDALNDIIARSESEIDIFESVDKKRREEEMGAWMKLVKGNGSGDSECLPPLPSRLLMDDDLKAFYEAMKISETPQQAVASNGGMKRKGDYLGGLDTRQYGRGKRAREIRSYEEQLTEEEFEKLCQVDSPESPQGKEEITEKKLSTVMCDLAVLTGETPQVQVPQQPPNPPVERAILHSKDVTPPSKRGRGRPRRAPTTTELSPSPGVLQLSSGAEQMIAVPKVENVSLSQVVPVPDSLPSSTPGCSISGTVQQVGIGIVSGTQSASLPPVVPAFQPTTLPGPSMPVRGRGRGRKAQSRGEAPRRRGKRQTTAVVQAPPTPTGIGNLELETTGEAASNYLRVCNPDPVSQPSNVIETTDEPNPISPIPLVSSSATSKSDLGSQEVPVPNPLPATDAVSNHSITPAPAPFPGSLVAAGVTQDPIVTSASCPDPVPTPSFPSIISDSQSAALAHPAPKQGRGRGRKAQTGGEAPRRRGKRQNPEAPSSFEVSTDQDPKSVEVPEKKPRVSVGRRPTRRNKQEHDVLKQVNVLQSVASLGIADPSTGQVCDNGPIDEAGKRTNVTLLDASQNRVDSVIVSVLFEDKQDNESQIPTNSVQAGASQSAGAPTMVQVNKDHEGKEDECQTDSIQSNPSQDINSLPVGQICDGKLENEAQKQMNIFDSGSSEVLADSPTLEGSKAERDDEVQKPKELVQLDPSLVITDSSVENIAVNQQEKEAQKQMNIVQSDPSPTTLDTAPTQANEVEQENEAPKPVCGARSYASQSIADQSRVQREVSEAEHQTGGGETDAPQCVLDSAVVDANKDVQENNAHVLSNDVESDTPQNISDPSVGVARDVDHKSEAQKESDVQSDAAAVSSGSVPEVEDADNRESDAHILNNVLESVTPQNFRDFSVGEVREVDLESEAQKKDDVRSDVTIVISGSVPEVEEAENKETDAHILNDVMESGTPQNIADPLFGVVLHVDPESEAREETAAQSDVTAVISESVPKVENADNKESDAHILNDVVESGAPQNIADPLVGVIREVNLESEAQKETEVESDATAVISGLLLKDEDANNEGSNAHVLNDIMESGTPQNVTDHSVGGVWHVDQESEAQKEAEVQLDATAVLSGSVPEVEDADNKESDAHILNDVVESGMPQNITYPSVGEAHDVDQENESQEETDVHSDMNAKSGSVAVFDADDKGSDADVLNDVMEPDAPKNIAEPSVGEIRYVDLEIEAQNETDIQSDTPYDIGDPSAGEFRDVDQKIESQKETDIQSDRTAIISGSDPIVELADGNCRSEPREEGGAGLGEVQSFSGGIHSTLSTSVTSGSDILHGGADDHVRNKEPFPEVGCDSIPPTEENASGALDVTLRNIDHFSIEQDPTEEESKEAAASDLLASKPQLEENSHSALTVSSSSFCAPENESGEEHTERNCIVDDALVSDLGFTEKRNISEKCGDDSVLLLSSNSSILSPNDQSNESEALAAVSSFVSVVSIVETEVSENLTGEDGSKEVEQKDYAFHGSQSSDLLDEGAAAPDSELLEERSDSHCDKTDAEDHEKNENVSSQDSMSVLCTDENFASVPDHAPYELVDLHQKGDANCLESKATGLDEVSVLKHELTVSQTSKEMSSATLITIEPMAQQLDTTVTETGIQAVEEHANQQENIDPFVEEPLVRKLEVTDANVTFGKADEDELKNKNDLFSTHGLADSQSLGEITSLTCSALKIEALIAVPPNEECQNQVDNGFQMGEVGLASKVNQAVVSAPDNCETVTKSTSAVLDVVAEPQQYVEEKASAPLEILNINVAHDGAKEESVELNDDFASKVIENRNDELVSNAEATSQSFKVLEESTVLNAEMNETRSSPNDGESNNEGDLLLVEGSPLMDVSKEVAVSAVQILSLKDALPDMAEVGCDSGGDESEKLESRVSILEKDSLAREEITSARNLVETTLSSNLVFKTENRNMEMVPNAEVVDGNAPNSNVSPILVTEFCDNETNCVANLPETMDDSKKSIAEEASSSLEVASLDVTPAEVSVEKSEIGPCIDIVADVQRSKEVELGKTVAADSEIHEPQPSVNAGTSQPKNGLQQLVEQYSETATDVEVSVTDSLTVDLRSSSQSSVDDSLKACQIQDSSALPASVEECSCPAENEENVQQQ